MPSRYCVTAAGLAHFGVDYPDWRLLELEAAGKFPRRVEVNGQPRWDPDEVQAWRDRQRKGGRHAPPA